MGGPSPTELLAAEIMPRSRFRCHSAWMLYVFEASFSNSRADLLSHSSSFWSLSIPSTKTVFSVPILLYLNLRNFKTNGLSFFFPFSFLNIITLLFRIRAQSQVPDSLSLSLVSVVLSWSSSILYWVELGSELASDFLFQLFGILKRGGSCGFLLFASSLGWHDDKAGAADTYLALITVWLGIEGWWNNESIRSIGDLLLCTH